MHSPRLPHRPRRCRPIGRSSASIASLLALATLAALPRDANGQQSPSSIALVGAPTHFELATQRADTSAPDVVSVPVRLTPANASLRVSVLEVLVGGLARPLDRASFAFELNAAAGPEPRILVARVFTWRLRPGDLYVVRLSVTPAAAAGASQTLDLTFTRVAPRLAVTPLELEVTTWAPWCALIFWRDCASYEPASVLVDETGGRASLDLRSVSATSELRGPANQLASPRMTPAWNVTLLPAGGQVQAGITLDARDLPLGVTSGKLVLRSPHLAAPVELSVRVRARLAVVWLLATLVASVFVGHLVRNRIETKRRVADALIAVETLVDEATRALTHATDRGLRTRLGQFLDELRSKKTTAGDDVEKLDRLAREQKVRLDQIRAEHAQALQSLRARVDQMRRELATEGESAPAVVDALSKARRVLDGVDAELARENAGAARAALDAREVSERARVRDAVQGWLDTMAESLSQSGAQRWTETPSDAARAALAAELTERAATTSDLPALLRYEQDVNRRFRARILESGATEHIEAARDVARRLQGAGVLEAKALAPIDDAMRRLTAIQVGGVGLDELPAFQEADRALWTALHHAVAAAAAALATKQGKPQNPGVQSALAKGRIAEALSLALDPTGADSGAMADALRTPEAPARSARPRAAAAAAAAAAPAWSINIERTPAATDVDLLTPVVMTVRAHAVTAAPPDDITIAWYVNGAFRQSSGLLGNAFDVPTDVAGQVAVRAEARAAGDPMPRAQTAVLTVREARDEGLSAIRRLLGVIQTGRTIQTVVFGTLIALSGMLLFQQEFVGTFQNFITAFFWGFLSDIGLDRVRELAPPAPGARPNPTAPVSQPPAGQPPAGAASVDSVEVTAPAPSVEVTKTMKLTAILRDAQRAALSGRPVAWSSAAPATATVDKDSGVVTGVAAGDAAITATCDGKTGTVTVRVTAAAAPPPGPAPGTVASVRVTDSTATVAIGAQKQLAVALADASGAPLNGRRTVTWASSDPGVATVEPNVGLVTGVAAGRATVTATVEGKSGSSTVTVA